jgi:hypothetical protein
MAFRKDHHTVERVDAAWSVAAGPDESGRPMVVRVAQGYRDVTNRSRFAFRIDAIVELADVRPNGLPTEEQGHSLAQTERELDAFFAREAALVAVVTGAARRTFQFQVRVATAFAEDGSSVRRMGAHDVRFEITLDREWAEYDRLVALAARFMQEGAARSMLPPSEVRADDRAVLEQLARRGVDLGLPRTVHHYVYVFSDAAQREAAAMIAATGWNVEQRPPSAQDPQRRVVVATRADVVLDDATVGAMRSLFDDVAQQTGGEYDGWEAAV